MIQSTQSPLKYEPEKLPDGTYRKILKDPAIMHPSLICDRKAKWHNPEGEHVVIECYPDDKWLARDINAGHLIKVQLEKKPKAKTDSAPAPEKSLNNG